MSSWAVPGGFTNTGLCALPDGTLAVGDFDSERIVICTTRGALLGSITLASSPDASVQGVAWDTLRSHFWVSHYSTPNLGSLRRYDTSGALQQTIDLSAITGANGPNGCVYDAANDRILIASTDNRIRGIDCTDGSVDENLLLASSAVGSGTVDGVTLDPVSPTTRLWVIVDAPQRKIAKVNRSTGEAVSLHDSPAQPESLAWLGGLLYICCDALFHDSVPNGNRVHWLSPETPGAHTLPIGSYAVG